MDIFNFINNETSIEKLKNFASNYIRLLYDKTMNTSHRAEVMEFIISNLDLSSAFPYFDSPKVSIVIPVKNEYTLTCALLNSIKKNTQNIDFEVIIADDNSDDETVNIEKKFKNIRRIINNTGHDGFVYNVNNAISHAKGEYIFLMNNDMITLPNYLSELLNIMEKDETIGIAGSKILSIDNTIAECGLIMEKGGYIGFPYAGEKADFLDDKDYIDCDYCSASAILFKRLIFINSGLFDTDFAPAYFDDSDFAFNLKYNFNLKSVCVPKSKLYHFFNMSYSNCPDRNESFLKNRKLFTQKWGKYLN